MSKHRKQLVRLLATLPVLSGFAAQVAHADLEEVVVTAQKRSQSLQEVPLSVTAFSAKLLADYGMQNFDDIAIPGVHIGTGSHNESLFVRGVGSGSNWGFEQSVPIYIDGTYYGRARAEGLGFLDVERIEVLKGPQPTYFGQNAIAGAVSITSARPTKELSGYVDLAYENNAKEKTVSAALSGPFSEALRARTAIRSRESEGWMTNVVTNTRVPQHKDMSARLSGELDVSKNFKVYAKYETSDEKQYGSSKQLINCGLVSNPASIGDYIDRSVEDCKFNSTQATKLIPSLNPGIPADPKWGYVQKTKYDGGLVALDWDLNGYKLSSITSSYKLDWASPQNSVDGGTKNISDFIATDVNKLTSQEFRILSPAGQSLEWVAGAYFDHADLSTSVAGDLYLFGSALPVAPVIYQNAQQTTKSRSIFGEASFKMSAQLTGKLGGRYSEVEKNAVLTMYTQQMAFGNLIPTPFIPGPPGTPCCALFPAFNKNYNRKDTSFQPAATIEYRPAKDLMTYASWKKGFKAGGSDTDALTIPSSGTLAFGPEKVDSYEAGFKSRLMDGKATFNVAAFRSDYSDLQVSAFTGTIGFSTTNAAKARSQGLEADGAIAVNNNLTLKAALTFLDAKYQSFPGASCNSVQTVATAPGVDCTQNMSGKTLQFAPDFSGNVGATLKYPLGASLKGSAQIDVFFTSKYQTANSQDPNTIQEGFSKIDLRFAIAPQNGNWELALVGRNITNKYTSHWIDAGVFGPFGTGIAYQAFFDRPRQIELQAKYSF